MAGGGSSELRQLADQIMQLSARLLMAEQKIRELQGERLREAARQAEPAQPGKAPAPAKRPRRRSRRKPRLTDNGTKDD